MIVVPYVLAALAGLLAGWVTNILAERFPDPERPLFGPLRCVRSGEQLTLRDYLPVVGFLWQRGRCRHCGKALPWRFPLVEIALACAFAFAWPIYESQPLYYYLVNVFYIFLLAAIALIDWRYRLIFPIMIYAGCLFGLGVAFFIDMAEGRPLYFYLIIAGCIALTAIVTLFNWRYGWIPLALIYTGCLAWGLIAFVPGSFKENPLLPDGIGSVLMGALLDGGIFYLIYIVAYAIYRRRALGFGDVLLAILIGVVLGYPRAISALFLGAVLGGLVAVGFFLFGGKRWRDFIPYGTTLCIGVILILIWGPSVWKWGPFEVLTTLMRIIFRTIFGWFGLESE